MYASQYCFCRERPYRTPDNQIHYIIYDVRRLFKRLRIIFMKKHSGICSVLPADRQFRPLRIRSGSVFANEKKPAAALKYAFSINLY